MAQKRSEAKTEMHSADDEILKKFVRVLQMKMKRECVAASRSDYPDWNLFDKISQFRVPLIALRRPRECWVRAAHQHRL
jgi:hypothetical protein